MYLNYNLKFFKYKNTLYKYLKEGDTLELSSQWKGNLEEFSIPFPSSGMTEIIKLVTARAATLSHYTVMNEGMP